MQGIDFRKLAEHHKLEAKAMREITGKHRWVTDFMFEDGRLTDRAVTLREVPLSHEDCDEIDEDFEGHPSPWRLNQYFSGGDNMKAGGVKITIWKRESPATSPEFAVEFCRENDGQLFVGAANVNSCFLAIALICPAYVATAKLA